MSSFDPPGLSRSGDHPNSSPPAKEPFYKKWWFWVIAGTIVFYMVMPKVDTEVGTTATPSTTPSTVALTTTVPELKYQEILNLGVVSSELSQQICKPLKLIIIAQKKSASRYIALTDKVVGNAYKGQEFINANSWTSSSQGDTFVFELETTAGGVLAAATMSTPTRSMQLAFLLDSLVVCDLQTQYDEALRLSTQVDSRILTIRSSVKNLPWYPEGFASYDSNTAYRFQDKGEFRCDYFSCWGMEFVSKVSCSSFYVEITILDSSGANIGYSNDSASGVQPNQKVKMKFDAVEDAAQTARLAKVSCY